MNMLTVDGNVYICSFREQNSTFKMRHLEKTVYFIVPLCRIPCEKKLSNNASACVTKDDNALLVKNIKEAIVLLIHTQ